MKLVEIQENLFINPEHVICVYEKNLRDFSGEKTGEIEVRVRTVDCVSDDAIGYLSDFSLKKTLGILGAECKTRSK